ncbi:MAG: AAA family ATPase [Prevotellaceae bacterium]|jgi:predicted ATP-dependent endonuclease of OLD family|nr:AAA family ATPase [Prevotellaceae bacterium]
MYISKIKIKGFRNFKDKEILFNDGINVIIGHNNAGKSNVLKAISLVIDTQSSKRLDIHDLNQNTSLEELKANPPIVTISLFISQSDNEDTNSDDLVTVGNYLTRLEAPYEALLTYDFFLPESEREKYIKALSEVTDIQKAWKIIKHDFIRLYISKIWGGDPNLQMQADSESLQKFDFQFLDAIRDVERDMFSGRNTLLRDVLDFFMDYDIKNDTTKDSDTKIAEIKALKEKFSTDADVLLQTLQDRMQSGKEQILDYAKQTGASFNKANPDFDGSLSDVELFSALKLIIKYETGITIPATHNGLGYNNLIFMSLLLAKMQVNSDGNYLGSNAKVFPILAIEEPEAHLHPAMQYKFLKFLKENKDVKKKARQIFVTTHSTQITSAVSLDEIICLHNENNVLSIGYPGKVFNDCDEDKKSKAYVQRFLDATKSDMLFAQKVILVEGIAEELLLPTMAKYISHSVEDSHIAIINVGGRYFDHFIKLFSSSNGYSIPKKIACITDRDPSRKAKNGGKNFEKCYPYEFNHDSTNFDYVENAQANINKFGTDSNIRFFSQDIDKGKTFEYDLILHNHDLELLITESMRNQQEIKELMQSSLADAVSKLRAGGENDRIIQSLELSQWSDAEKKKALIASRYLNSIGKGENSLELCYCLEDNLLKPDAEKKSFVIPQYIKDAIEWLIQ